MKPRRVIVTLEMDTAASFVDLKNKWRWRAAWNKYHDVDGVRHPFIVVDQVSVNVVKQPRPKRKKSK